MSLDYSKMKPFVYIMVCSDLSPRQKVVQACHAALEAGIHLEQCDQFPSGMIMLQCSGEKSLMKAAKKIENKGIKCRLFYEPPMKRYTALATEVIPQEKRKLLRKFQLLSMPGDNWWNKVKQWIKRKFL